MCCYMRTIELCIAVLKSAALFMQNNFSIIFVPVVMALILIGYFIWWMFVLVHVWSVGTYTKRTGLPIGQVSWTSQTRAFVYIHMFSLLWNGCFILYYGQFVIILATCLWYFDHHPKTGKTIKGGVIRKAITWAFIKHLGSIAFAALILAIIVFLRILMYYLQVKFFYD
jgi:solute carrier family 44 (choline transporter-like protein), member 2/4/5